MDSTALIEALSVRLKRDIEQAVRDEVWQEISALEIWRRTSEGYQPKHLATPPWHTTEPPPETFAELNGRLAGG